MYPLPLRCLGNARGAGDHGDAPLLEMSGKMGVFGTSKRDRKVYYKTTTNRGKK